MTPTSFDPKATFNTVVSKVGIFAKKTQDAVAKVLPDSNSVRTKLDGELFIVEAALPGFSKSEIETKVDENNLIITAKRSLASEIQLFDEQVERIIPLPVNARVPEMKAKFVSGLLRITVPVSELAPVNVVLE